LTGGQGIREQIQRMQKARQEEEVIVRQGVSRVEDRHQ